MLARIPPAAVGFVTLWTSLSQAQQPPPQPYPYPPPAASPHPAPQPYPQPYPYPPPQPYPYPPSQPYPQPYPYPPPASPYPQPYSYPQPQQAPAPAVAAEPKQVESEYVVTEPIYALIVGGVISFSLAYVIPLIAAGASGFENGSAWLAIPLAGPFVTIGERDWGNCPDPDDCNDKLVAGGLAMSIIFQAAGIGMFLGGVLSERTYVETVYALTPIVTDDSAGVGLTATF